MTDQQPHTPTTEDIRLAHAESMTFHVMEEPELTEANNMFDRWLATIEAAAEQRGAERAFRKTQEIIAGFEHTIDEARERDDMINAGYLIQEIDTEIQDLMEGNDD